MNDTRMRILKHAMRMAAASGDVPSLNELALVAGVSKGGLIHHFPSRLALLEAMARHGIQSVDAALDEARESRAVLQTWLELSLPSSLDVTLFQALASVFFATRASADNLELIVAEAYHRWERMLADELGSASAARVARLLGDGLLMGAVTGSITTASAHTYLASSLHAARAVAESPR